jgi:hypothetical protein
VPTLGGCGTQGRFDLANDGLVKFMTVFVAKIGSTYPWVRISDGIVTMIPSKQKHAPQLSAIALN